MITSPENRDTALLLILLIAVCVVALLAYWPGLSGDFLFDDWVNLPLLGRYGGIRDLDTLLLYLTSGFADPTGRPVAQLTFLLDARDWPAAPYAFKRTNLLLHLINGLLLFAVLAGLGRRLAVERGVARTAALLAASAWLLHPLWVSTVLYVIQRQAMLAMLFVLCGILAWTKVRDAFDSDRRARAWLLAVVAVPVCGTVAGLSKANGFLLPLLLLALETTVLRAPAIERPVHARDLATMRALLVFASVALAALVAWQAQDAAIAERDWSTAQRLLTQPRALLDYLRQLIVPGLGATGLFADAFPVSRSWNTPATTLPSLAMLSALGVAAWFGRKRWPAFAAAVLFYLAGHVMESGLLPLELYFEHRNYLPAALLFWPAALWLASPGAYAGLKLFAAGSFIAICAIVTAAQAQLWGEPVRLAQVWAEQLPNSARAQANAASYDAAAGRPHAVIARLQPLFEARPDEAQYALPLLDAYCALGEPPPRVLALASRAFAARGVSSDIAVRWLAVNLAPSGAGYCAGLSDPQLSALLQAALRAPVGGEANMETVSRRSRLIGLHALRSCDCPGAVAAFEQRIAAQKRPEFAQDHAGLLAMWCGPDAALTHISKFREDPAPFTPAGALNLRLRDFIMERQGFWKLELDRLQHTLSADAAALDAHSGSGGLHRQCKAGGHAAEQRISDD